MHTVGPVDGGSLCKRRALGWETCNCEEMCSYLHGKCTSVPAPDLYLTSQPQFISLLSCTLDTKKEDQHSVVTLSASVMTNAHAHFLAVAALTCMSNFGCMSSFGLISSL
jgi:hypothetical protein